MSFEGKQFSHYRILRLIGRGGMGEVYLAEDIQLLRQVAVKVIRIETGQSDDEAVANMLRQFLREATAIARLDHPHILPLYDHGETTIDGSRIAYLIMPYRPEGSLVIWQQKFAQAHQLTAKQVMHVIQQASLALQYAHDHDTMHLDVKPANFLVRNRRENDDYPDLLLSDFGIARLASATSSASQNVRGTPTYMAPEQWAGQPAFASDQYALAVMAYELLTGNPPFQGTPMHVMYAHLQDWPKPASALNSRLSSAIDRALQRALAKKPSERFPSVALFAQAFQNGDEVTALDGFSSLPPTSASPTPLMPVAPTQLALPPHHPVIPLPITRTQPAPPQRSAMFPTPLMRAQSTSRGSFPGSIILILLILILLVGMSGGVYAVATGHWPWNISYDGTSANGSTWTVRTTATSQRLEGAAWSGSQFVVVGGSGTILTSPDGRVWIARTSGTSQRLESVAWSGSQFVVVGYGGTILTSSDGSSWTAQTSGTSRDLIFLAWSGSQFVAVGYGGTILTSSNGSTWTAQTSGTSQRVENIIWSGSQFVAVGDGGTILTSPDGSTWTAQTSGISQQLLAVAASHSQFVAVGDGGTILTSPDGSTWTAQTTATSQRLEGVAWSGSQFVAVGDGGTILTSPDGSTWTAQTSGTSQDLISLTWSGSQFVAVGENGTILTSP